MKFLFNTSKFFIFLYYNDAIEFMATLARSSSTDLSMISVMEERIAKLEESGEEEYYEAGGERYGGEEAYYEAGVEGRHQYLEENLGDIKKYWARRRSAQISFSSS